MEYLADIPQSIVWTILWNISPSIFNTSLGTLGMLMNGKSCLIPILCHRSPDYVFVVSVADTIKYLNLLQ